MIAFLVPQVSIWPTYYFCLAHISDYRTVGLIQTLKYETISHIKCRSLLPHEEGEMWPLWVHIFTRSYMWLELSRRCPQKSGSNSLLPIYLSCPYTSKSPVDICICDSCLECNIVEGKECEHVSREELCPQQMSAQCWAGHKHLINMLLIIDTEWMQLCGSKADLHLNPGCVILRKWLKFLSLVSSFLN